MRIARTAVAALPLLVVVFMSGSAWAGTPCAHKDFKTTLVKAACEKGGQAAAKDAMKAFAKDHKIKSCNQCHEKLAPGYELKADAVERFAKLGGALIGVGGQPTPAKAPAPGDNAGKPIAQLRPQVPASDDPKLAFEKYVLPNGLEVILAPDTSVPIVTVNVWYHVGSGHEVHGHSGFAHLFEHMMFQGSHHVGEDKHFDILKKIGADGVNGTTNQDRTNYFETVPSNQLETGLWLESDRMGYLLQPPNGKDGKPIDFKTSLDNQIEVVRNERRQNYDNQPYGKARFANYAGLYPEGHPYRYLTIGRHEDLIAASVADVQGFFKTWYVPANATLAIVGDFDVPQAKQLIEKWFGKFPNSAKPKVVAVAAPSIKASTITVSDDFAKLRQIQFSWHSPANYGDGDAELDIVANALSRDGGRLYKALVYDRPLAQSVSAFQNGSTYSGIFSVTVTLRSEANLDEVKQIVAGELARITREVLSAKEIGRVIAGNEAGAIRGFETTLGRAQALQGYNHYLGDPDKLTWDLDRYRKTTPVRIRDIAAKYLVPDRMVTVITNPNASGAKQ
ncbi:MAG: protease, insulinase family/protease, insulinase family [Deltaproteobacteria bacterium]|nr:protease, insulinase family/protease, insulinase family [Deltaproteobacteria bacterium]